jgi:hypothetical protein
MASPIRLSSFVFILLSTNISTSFLLINQDATLGPQLTTALLLMGGLWFLLDRLARFNYDEARSSDRRHRSSAKGERLILRLVSSRSGPGFSSNMPEGSRFVITVRPGPVSTRRVVSLQH